MTAGAPVQGFVSVRLILASAVVVPVVKVTSPKEWDLGGYFTPRRIPRLIKLFGVKLVVRVLEKT